MKKVVVIGGGTGTYTVLKGLRDYPELTLSAVVTMADDGGSNKVLRDEMGMLPTSGVRQCMVAMSSNEGLLRELFTYRYYRGAGISGMTFGNLFMAAASDILGDKGQAIKETAKLLGVRGQILPVSYEQVSLLAKYEDGAEVLGEHLIDEGRVGSEARIVSLRTVPQTKIDCEAKRAILEADLLILGPGDLYTNTIANLVVSGLAEAIVESKARLCFVMNLMTKRGESPRYKASDFLLDLGKYLPLERVEVILMNTEQKVSKTILEKYEAEGSWWVVDDLESEFMRRIGCSSSVRVERKNLMSKTEVKRERGDKMVRSMVRHDARKLARALVALI
jgi:uncharacterized cofD-like protein